MTNNYRTTSCLPSQVKIELLGIPVKPILDTTKAPDNRTENTERTCHVEQILHTTYYSPYCGLACMYINSMGITLTYK